MKILRVFCIFVIPVILSAAVPQLVKVSIYPGHAELRGSKAQQTLSVTALYSNGVEYDVTAKARFRASTPEIARIGQTGIAVPVRDGKTMIEAGYQGKTAVAELVVSEVGATRTASFLRDVAPI